MACATRIVSKSKLNLGICGPCGINHIQRQFRPCLNCGDKLSRVFDVNINVCTPCSIRIKRRHTKYAEQIPDNYKLSVEEEKGSTPTCGDCGIHKVYGPLRELGVCTQCRVMRAKELIEEQGLDLVIMKRGPRKNKEIGCAELHPNKKYA